MPQNPISEKQLAANRANAARSTGPRSPEGKARAAQNSRRHGFTPSTFAVVRLEDLHDIAHLKDDLLAVYKPINSQELFAIERIALAQQALLRAARPGWNWRWRASSAKWAFYILVAVAIPIAGPKPTCGE